MTRAETIKANLAMYQALLQAKPHLPVVHKGKTAVVRHNNGGSHQYNYADLADVDRQVTPVLAEHGLMLDFEMHKTDTGELVLTGMLIHPESGGYKTSEWDVTGRTPQDQGTSITYGRRYLTGILTGLITDDDTDGRQAEPGARPAPRRTKKPTNPASAEQIAQIGKASKAGLDMRAIMQHSIGRVATPDDITADEAARVIDAALDVANNA